MWEQLYSTHFYATCLVLYAWYKVNIKRFIFLVYFTMFLPNSVLCFFATPSSEMLNLGGATFNSLNAFTTKALKDFYTIVCDNRCKAVGFPHIHSWWLVDCNYCINHFWMRKVHSIIPVWICFWPCGRYALCLVDPNTSSPSKCSILMERPKIEVCLVIITTIWTWSPNWLALRNYNSFLFGLVQDALPCKRHNTMKIFWMLAHNH